MSGAVPIAQQVRCPYCNAPHAGARAGAFTCDFCLQPFLVEDARREEARLLDEIKTWVEQRVGQAGAGAAVDVASRAYIWQQRVLPDLRRDVDRAVERFGGHAQFPLVAVPVRVPQRQTFAANPLVVQRREILGLKGLRARLGAEEITAFATRDGDRLALRWMDRHLTSLVHLSNVAEAAAALTPAGYAAARRNLELLLEDTASSIASEGAADPALARFLHAQQERFGALAEICRICEEAAAANRPSGAALAGRSEAVAGQLAAVAARIEGSQHAPADTMPVVVAVHQEAAAARALGQWLRAYDAINTDPGVGFPEFVTDLDALTGGGAPGPQAELLGVVGHVLAAVRGGAALPVAADFSWVDGWVERHRQKRTMGLFGSEEKVGGVTRFLSPVWIADVTYSRAQGAVFTSGQELRGVAVVDACAPLTRHVAVLAHERVLAALGGPGASLAGVPVAMPRSSPAEAADVIHRALRGRPGYLNVRVRIRGLGYVGAAAAVYETAGAPRRIAAALDELVAIDAFAATQTETTQRLLQRYG